MSQIWFTADLHLGHQNIMRYCKRPFSTIGEHDKAIIKNINDRVMPRDTLYVLGDFSFSDTSTYRDQIHCKNVVLIMGNHDPHRKSGAPDASLESQFQTIRDLMKIRVEVFGIRQEIILCHYAMRTWNKSHHGTYHCYGHSHYTLPDDPKSLSIDVGIDAVAGRATGKTHEELVNGNAWDLLCTEQYKPLSSDDIGSIMATKDFVPIDHHK